MTPIPTLEIYKFVDFLTIDNWLGQLGTSLRWGLYLFFLGALVYVIWYIIHCYLTKERLRPDPFFSIIVVYLIDKTIALAVDQASKLFYFKKK